MTEIRNLWQRLLFSIQQANTKIDEQTWIDASRSCRCVVFIVTEKRVLHFVKNDVNEGCKYNTTSLVELWSLNRAQRRYKKKKRWCREILWRMGTPQTSKPFNFFIFFTQDLVLKCLQKNITTIILLSRTTLNDPYVTDLLSSRVVLWRGTKKNS